MNALDMKGRTAIVTGGASGIGYAICERLIEKLSLHREVSVIESSDLRAIIRILR